MGPGRMEEAAKDRKDIKDNELKQVDITFDDKYEIIATRRNTSSSCTFGHMYTGRQIRVRTCQSTKSFAPAMRASTERSTSWAIPTPRAGSSASTR